MMSVLHARDEGKTVIWNFKYFTTLIVLISFGAFKVVIAKSFQTWCRKESRCYVRNNPGWKPLHVHREISDLLAKKSRAEHWIWGISTLILPVEVLPAQLSQSTIHSAFMWSCWSHLVWFCVMWANFLLRFMPSGCLLLKLLHLFEKKKLQIFENGANGRWCSRRQRFKYDFYFFPWWSFIIIFSLSCKLFIGEVFGGVVEWCMIM